ncbi:MAG: winged helix-turn-helix transcriptional regulator [Candidatus Diapherotrites archaeon]|nr:winged helix-turn-helix transcriptional regulator [Candidatus Diapherotrites archaeon]
MKEFVVKPYSHCLETLGNELRLQIIRELGERPKSVQVLCKNLNVEQSRLSHSLQILKRCNFVEVKPDGKQRIYSLKSDLLTGYKEGKKDLFELLDSHIKDFCGNDCKQC